MLGHSWNSLTLLNASKNISFKFFLKFLLNYGSLNGILISLSISVIYDVNGFLRNLDDIVYGDQEWPEFGFTAILLLCQYKVIFYVLQLFISA